MRRYGHELRAQQKTDDSTNSEQVDTAAATSSTRHISGVQAAAYNSTSVLSNRRQRTRIIAGKGPGTPTRVGESSYAILSRSAIEMRTGINYVEEFCRLASEPGQDPFTAITTVNARKQEQRPNVVVARTTCHQNVVVARTTCYQAASSVDLSSYRRTIGCTTSRKADDKLSRLLFDWCKQNGVTNETDYFNTAGQSACALILEPNFQECLKRAVKASYHFFYVQQTNTWEWLLSQANKELAEQPLKWEYLLQIQSICSQRFVHTVREWLCKKHCKKNCLLLWGAVSTGKTLFANAIRGLFLHRQMSNSTGTSNFSFGNCLNTHVIIYEEPFLHPTLLEDMKSLLGGAEMTVDAKYSTQQPLRRTPVLITSNTLALSRGHASSLCEEALQERSFIFRFDNCIATLVANTVFQPVDFALLVRKFNGVGACTCRTCR